MPGEYSVIIVTYNSADWIRDCLQSLLSQRSDVSSLEIIIVDNASTDSTVSLLQKEFPEVQLVVNGNNAGFASAVNRGASVARYPNLLILNPDTQIQNGFFPGLDKLFSGNPQEMIVGCKLLNENGTVQPSCWKMPSLLTQFLETFLPYESSLPLVTEIPVEFRRVDTVSGACMIFSKTLFQRLQGFDERFFMYYEDFDFCRRARDAGAEVSYYPGSSVTHHVRKSTSSNGEMFFLHVYQSKLKFFHKHESSASYLLAYLMIVVGITLRIPVYAIAGMLFSKKELLQLSKYHTFVLPKIIGAGFREKPHNVSRG